MHDALAKILRVVDTDEAESICGVVAGGVEVDRADFHDPIDGRLFHGDVLDAIDVRAALGLGEDPTADVEALGRDRVLREEALQPACNASRK